MTFKVPFAFPLAYGGNGYDISRDLSTCTSRRSIRSLSFEPKVKAYNCRWRPILVSDEIADARFVLGNLSFGSGGPRKRMNQRISDTRPVAAVMIYYRKARSAHQAFRYNFGTTSVQLRERKNGLLAPKRHQMKHLDFFDCIFRDQEVGGSNPLAPTNLFCNPTTYKSWKRKRPPGKKNRSG